jgi:hypothetical protein
MSKDLWDSLSKTDPRYTKSFTRGGGFSGTAINAQWIVQRLTETFGPIGGTDTWGYEVLDEQLVPGKPFLFNNQVFMEQIHHVTIRFWFTWEGKTHVLPKVFGNTVFVGTHKSGPFSDEEASEKSVTDALSKAAKRIGVAADIHLGLWDDNKYVADRTLEVHLEIAENLLGSAADQGTEAFRAAYKALSDRNKEVVKPYLGSFEKRVKKADAQAAELAKAQEEVAEAA